MFKALRKLSELLNTRSVELDLEIKAGIVEIKRQPIEFKEILNDDLKTLLKGN